MNLSSRFQYLESVIPMPRPSALRSNASAGPSLKSLTRRKGLKGESIDALVAASA